MFRGARSIAAAWGLAAGLCMGPATASKAADFEVHPLDSGEMMIALVGEITTGDAEKFRKLAIAHPKAFLLLGSNGGTIVEALEIGRMVRLQGYVTLVVRDAPCNSACALIWLAGSTRFLGEGAKVGFHASYYEEGGRLHESGVANALVGNYLNQLNLSERAIVFATSASPQELNWLSIENAAAAGIPFERLPMNDDDKSAAAPETADSDLFRTVGAWDVRVDDSLRGGCFITSPYKGGVHFRIGLDMRGKQPEGYVAVFGEAWESIKEKEEYDVTLQFGELEPWSATASGINLGGLRGLVVTFSESELFKEFAEQPNVILTYKGREAANLNLKDSRAALAALTDCQRGERQAARDPFRK